jgi:hypothetical protein
LSFGIGCCLAVKITLDSEWLRREQEMRRLHAQGDHDAVVRTAKQGTGHGTLLVALCVAGGVSLYHGTAMLLGQ